MHYQDLGSKRKFVSGTKSNMKHCKMGYLSICGNVFNKLLIRESIDCVSSEFQHRPRMSQKRKV